MRRNIVIKEQLFHHAFYVKALVSAKLNRFKGINRYDILKDGFKLASKAQAMLI